MLSASDVEPMTGFSAGAVCPFANPAGTRVFLDSSLKRFDVVYPSGGSASSAVRMTIEELELTSGAEGWVEVTQTG